MSTLAPRSPPLEPVCRLVDLEDDNIERMEAHWLSPGEAVTNREVTRAGLAALQMAAAIQFGPADDPLTYLHLSVRLMHMRTTLILNDDLIAKARELTGMTEKTALIHAGLEALIARESAKRLAELGGTAPTLGRLARRGVARRRRIA